MSGQLIPIMGLYATIDKRVDRGIDDVVRTAGVAVCVPVHQCDMHKCRHRTAIARRPQQGITFIVSTCPVQKDIGKSNRSWKNNMYKKEVDGKDSTWKFNWPCHQRVVACFFCLHVPPVSRLSNITLHVSHKPAASAQYVLALNTGPVWYFDVMRNNFRNRS